MNLSIKHKINIYLFILSIAFSLIVELFLMKNAKPIEIALNVMLMTIISYSILYCISSYQMAYGGRVYEGFEEHMVEECGKSVVCDESESDEEINQTNDDTDDEEKDFLSTKKPSIENFIFDKGVNPGGNNDNSSENEMLKSIQDELKMIRSDLNNKSGSVENRSLVGGRDRDRDSEKVIREQQEWLIKNQQKNIRTDTPLKYEDGWSVLEQPGQWQYPPIRPPQCIMDSAKDKETVLPALSLNRPFSTYMTSNKFNSQRT